MNLAGTQYLPGIRGYLESTSTKPLSASLVGQNKAMRIIYSDEAGVGDEAVEPIVVVAAIIIEADYQWTAVEMVIKEILRKYVPQDRRETFEFKAARLYGHLSKSNNEAILCAFLQILEIFQLPVPWGAVNRVGMRQHWEANGLYCPVETMQNLAFIGAAVQAETVMNALWPNERAIWIADETRAKIPMKTRLREYQKAAIVDEEPTTQFKHILDTVYFGNSHESIGIQLADACNFFIKRHHMGDASADRFFRMIYPYMPGRDGAPIYSNSKVDDE